MTARSSRGTLFDEAVSDSQNEPVGAHLKLVCASVHLGPRGLGELPVRQPLDGHPQDLCQLPHRRRGGLGDLFALDLSCNGLGQARGETQAASGQPDRLARSGEAGSQRVDDHADTVDRGQIGVNAVPRRLDTAVSECTRIWPVSTMAERVTWVLQNTTNPKTGKKWSQRSLSLAAGLSQSHVGQILRGRLGENQRGNTAKKIAAAAGINHVWLMTGDGEPRLETVPARKLAAELCREAEVLEAAVLAVLAEAPTEAQRRWHTLRWASYMQERALKMTLDAFQTEPSPASASRSAALPPKPEPHVPALPSKPEARARR